MSRLFPNSTSFKEFYLARDKYSDSDSVIIPYKVINCIFSTLYGIITGSLSAYFLRASFTIYWFWCHYISEEYYLLMIEAEKEQGKSSLHCTARLRTSSTCSSESLGDSPRKRRLPYAGITSRMVRVINTTKKFYTHFENVCAIYAFKFYTLWINSEYRSLHIHL